jgi:hypothetical protein
MAQGSSTVYVHIMMVAVIVFFLYLPFAQSIFFFLQKDG